MCYQRAMYSQGDLMSSWSCLGWKFSQVAEGIWGVYQILFVAIRLHKSTQKYLKIMVLSDEPASDDPDIGKKEYAAAAVML